MSKRHAPAIAKINPPRVSAGVARPRLAALLDQAWRKPVVWLAAPAGSGKSTLAAAYLEARQVPSLWYQCDEGDADLASFFYYLGLAAKKAAPRRKPLPLLTPEFLGGIPAFTRYFFEQLYQRVVTIVIDNYQDIPGDAPLHEVIAAGFDRIPEGVNIVVISRTAVPLTLARLLASDKISRLHESDIRFTLDESMQLIHDRMPHLDSAHAEAIHQRAAGWAAGIVLMLEEGGLHDTGAVAVEDSSRERVFDYFAGEVFNRTDADVRLFLLKTALLPVLILPMVEKLTGLSAAADILSTLNRHHFFTDKLSGSDHSYRYHRLFREFLITRAKTELSAEELTKTRLKAASILEQAGLVEDAAKLYGDAGDQEGLRRLVLLHARELLTQGRNTTLNAWIARIDGQAANDPWVSYWSGYCAFPVDMVRARACFEQCFDSFKVLGDCAGLYLSWAGIVDTYAFGLDEWQPLDDCIVRFIDLKKHHPIFPTAEIDLIASSRLLIALTMRKTDQPKQVLNLLEHVSRLLLEKPLFDIRMDTLFSMILYYLWKGEYHKNSVLLDRAEAEIRHHKAAPFMVIRVKLMKGIQCWITGQYDAARQTLAEGLEVSAASGVHMFDSLLWCFQGAAEMAPGRLEQAEPVLRRQMTAMLGTAKTLDVFFYHVNAAWHGLLIGNPSAAAEHLEAVSTHVTRLGTPYYQALWHIGMAQTVSLLGRTKEARGHAGAAHRLALTMKSQVLEWYSLLIDAWILLREGREAEGLLSLHRALSLGRRHGYLHLEFHQPSVMRFLFAKALEKGIEPDYVKMAVKKLGLTPPEPPDCAAATCCLQEWPYPLKIYTLGRFEIEKDEEPLVFSGKEQKKPLELLKILIALGGSNVPEERLSDALWPDADGDRAHKSFEMALSRLRRLLGADTFLSYRARQLTLNPLFCWVDSLALTQLLDASRQAPAGESTLLCEQAAALHKGLFLPGDTGLPWVITSRETLKNRVMRLMLTAGRNCEKAGEWQRAADMYRQGVETDRLAEEFYRQLMRCQYRLGNHAEAVKTYLRCRDIMQAELGIDLSPETTSVYTAILQKK